ncbi:MAG TPA: hypothetical protein VLW08_08245, partial [Casimicrobiaceae bacterium]|nr:hypothetical protein [Casimicrobiaceae bacterium]
MAGGFAVMTSGGGGGVPAAGVTFGIGVPDIGVERRGTTPAIPMSVAPWVRASVAGVPAEGVRRRGTIGGGPPVAELMPISVFAWARPRAGGAEPTFTGGGVEDAVAAGGGRELPAVGVAFTASINPAPSTALRVV